MPPMAGLQLICPMVSMLWRQQQRLRAHARRGRGRLGAGVAAADDDDIVLIGVVHGAGSIRGVRERRYAYLPMQNSLKIRPSRSSGVTVPTISPNASWAMRSSSATSSGLALAV